MMVCYCSNMNMQDIAYDGERIQWANRSIRSPEATFGQICYNPGGFCGPRTQRYYELILLQSGSCVVTLDHVTVFPLKVGGLYLFQPKHLEQFQYDAGGASNHWWCAVHPMALPPETRLALDTMPDGFAVFPSECINHILASAFSLGTALSESHSVITALAIAIFAEFIHCAQRKSVKDVQITKAIQYMQDHLSDEDCLKKAQQVAACAKTAFTYKFTQVTGKTPSRYLWQLRTERGIHLLAASGLSISEISYRCGFKSPYHFSRCVQQLRSVSPRALRQAAWND